MLDLKSLLNKIMGCLYIQGTSGNWTYKKYANGILECWYNGYSGTYTCGTARGNMYAGGWLTYTYPVAFDNLQCVTASATLTTDAYTVLAQLSQPLNTSVKVRITSGSSIAANSYRMHIHAIGTWGGVIESIKRFFASLCPSQDWGWIIC